MHCGYNLWDWPLRFTAFGSWWSGTKLFSTEPGLVVPHVWHPVSSPIRLISRRSPTVKFLSGPRAGIDSPAKGPSTTPSRCNSRYRSSAARIEASFAAIWPSMPSWRVGSGVHLGSTSCTRRIASCARSFEIWSRAAWAGVASSNAPGIRGPRGPRGTF